MDSKLLFCTLLIFSMIISWGMVSAVNIDDNCTESVVLNEIDLSNNPNELNKDYEMNLGENISNDNDLVCDIYVDSNFGLDDGNGSYENPFSTLDLAYGSVTEYKDKINLYLFEGTYTIGSELIFNTSNLNIQSVSGNVTLKNAYNTDNVKQSFGMTASSANFTMSNIIFDGSNWTQKTGSSRCFTPFNGADNDLGSDLVIFNNCTFTGFTTSVLLAYSSRSYNCNHDKYIFNSCKFIDYTSTIGLGLAYNWNISFNYCIFTATFKSGIEMGYSESVIFDGIWWGQNNITNSYFYNQKGNPYYKNANYIFNRYAVFNVTENYLGNNQYEIIGKLMWNDTTDDDIDKLGPMTVTLSSSTGDLPETAILQDGTFRVIYNSTASTHDVTAKLDNEIITLNFNSTDMTVNTSDIIIGQDQNITVTLPHEFNGTLSINVNNKTYHTTVDNTNSITYKIPDVLPAGKHVIEVVFADEKNHIYAFNSTNITVSKVSDYDFNATVTPTVYLGDNATVTIITLPSGAAGNITVKVGDNEAKTFNSDDIISIDGFVAGNNVVNITFTSDMYDAKSVVKNVVASPKPTTIATVNVTTTYNVAKDLVITLTDVNGKILANKTVNVVVGTLNKNLTTNTSGQVSIDVSTLAPNTYVANIAFAGDEVYAKSNATANVVINKIASSLTAPAVTATYNVVRNLVITLTANGKALANQKVTVKVGTISKTLTTNAKGQVSVDVSKLTPKTYTATFTYAGDDINDKSSNTAKVVVNKVKPKITAKKATFKAKKKTKKYSIVLKDNKGKAIKKAKVTLKVKGKTYKATTNAKGKATFKITKLTKKGKQTATIKFGGNTLYKAVSKKVKLTIKK